MVVYCHNITVHIQKHQKITLNEIANLDSVGLYWQFASTSLVELRKTFIFLVGLDAA